MPQAKSVTRTDAGPVPAIVELRQAFDKMEEQFRFALPAHIPFERFKRVAMTALQNAPKLQRCSRQSLFNAFMRCAQDGLLPDGREAAIVPYGDSDAEGPASENAQYLPMIQGIRKKVRNAGVLTDWNVQIVQEGDQFDYQLGDDPFIRHKPSAHGGRTRKVLFAYSIATYPDGTKSREVMNVDQIEDIRKKSRARKGPWSDPVFYPEMCRKTVARLHSKQLPMSTDLDTLMRRDDELYDLKSQGDEQQQRQRRLESTTAALDYFAGQDEAEHQETTPDGIASGGGAAPDEERHASGGPAESQGPSESGAATASIPQNNEPKNYAEYRERFDAIVERATNAKQLQDWFKSEGERRRRNNAGVIEEERKGMIEILEKRVEALGGFSAT